MCGQIAHRGSITVREFISEFDGMSGTAKQKMALAETGASHVSLHDYFGRHKANGDNIAKLLAALQKYAKSIPPARLGIIGKARLYRMMVAAGGDPKTFPFKPRFRETNRGPPTTQCPLGRHPHRLSAGPAPTPTALTAPHTSPATAQP